MSTLANSHPASIAPPSKTRFSPWSNLDPTRSYTPPNPSLSTYPNPRYTPPFVVPSISPTLPTSAPTWNTSSTQRGKGHARSQAHDPTLPDSLDCLCLTPQLQTALGLHDQSTISSSSKGSRRSEKSDSTKSSLPSSADSYPSIKTPKSLNGGFFGAGRNWVQAGNGTPDPGVQDDYQGFEHESSSTRKAAFDVWSSHARRDSVTSTEACSPKSQEEYHLVSSPEDLLAQHAGPGKMPCFEQSLIQSESKSSQFREFIPRQTAPPKTPTHLDPSQFTSAQLAALAAALAPTSSALGEISPEFDSVAPHEQHPAHIIRLIAQSTRLAQGLAQPPANRGFRPRASDMMDKNGRDEHNTTVFVGGLSQGLSESILHDVFAPFGPIAYVKIPPGKGCGFVQFDTKSDAEYAIKQMQGFEILGCSLRTHWGRSQTDRSNQLALTSEQVSEQVVSVCAAFGVTREHAELVLRVLQACQGGSAEC